ncbi:hypothetical protein LBMAG53_14440 [Planctomycetota bacterium]|nr:hypothetical protein LBMAG53_14440 [Planctomycetota bacterium]
MSLADHSDMFRALCPLVLAAAAIAGDGPLISVAVADGPILSGHWAASLHGRLWLDPALEPLRKRYDEALAERTKSLGFDPMAVVAVAKQARLAVVALPSTPIGEGQVCASVEVGDLAKALMAAARNEGGVAAVVPGADEALTKPGKAGVLVRSGGRLTLNVAVSDPAAALSGIAAPAKEVDLVYRVDVPRLVAAMKPLVPATEVAATTALQALAPFGPIQGSVALRSEGLLEHIEGELLKPLPGHKPVDRALLGRLPATTLMTLAVGFDGKAWWKQNRQIVLGIVLETERQQSGVALSLDEAEQQLDGLLGGLGIGATAREIAEGIDGTAVFAVTQSVPFPAASLAVPRGKGIDAVAAWLAKIGHAELPAEGASALLTLPKLLVPLTLSRDKQHWLLTTDPAMTGQWNGGSPGGFADSAAGKNALAKAPATAVAIGASDTASVLRVASGYLSLGLGAMAVQPEQQQQILGAVNRLAGLAAPGYCYLSQTPTSWVWESRGLFGGLGTSVVVGGAAGPLAAVQLQPKGPPGTDL